MPLRVMALDVGQKRIGVAMSDPDALLAMPLTTIARRAGTKDVDEVLRLAAEHDVGEIVVGMPFSLSGRKGPQAERVSEFAKVLAGCTTIPISSVDERYSSVQAERSLRELGIEPSRNRARVDAAAASVILQSHLDARRFKAE